MALSAGPVARRPELDALRGLAALSILLFHAVGIYARGSAPDAAVRPWVAHLDVAVPVFFMLSGFLLLRALLAGRADLRRYARRRIERIVPGYWVALLVAALALELSGVLTLEGIVRYFGFLQAYDADTAAGGLPQGWTLCVEVAFYAMLPLVALALARRRPRGRLAALALLAAAGVAWKAVVLAGSDEFVRALDPWLIALPAYLDMFAAGMALAVADLAGRRPSARLGWAALAAAAALYVVTCVGAGLDDVDPRGFTHAQFAVRHTLYLAVAACVLIAALAAGGPARALRLAPLRRLGTISYGVYLYHLTVLGLLGKWDLASLEDTVHPYLLWTGAALGGTLVLAEMSWRLVERPALRAG